MNDSRENTVPPSGNISFLFTDIEGSTMLAQKYHKELPAALEIHHSILNESVSSNGGYVFKIIGDAFCCAFASAAGAVSSAIDIQRKLSETDWKDVVIRVRIGIHSGDATWDGNGYDGYLTLSRAERVMSAGHGGQILISHDAFESYCNDEPDAYYSALRGGVSFADLGERKLKDLVNPVRLYQVNAPGLTAEFPPPKSLDLRPNNLPLQITNFIGREKEMLQINENLKTASLITLTGTGGSGKTRLALQAGAEELDNFADGVWFAELAQLSDGELVAQAIGRIFGLDESSGTKPDEALISFLRNKETLLIIDNCEHIIEASARVAEKLLASCPRLKIIATSREALKISGEKIFRVQSLAAPGPEERLTSETISQFEAVKLFIDRAAAVDSRFQVNNDNAPALAEICFRLDGIPLAIELAAARIKVLSLEKINERLGDRFKLLTGGRRTVLPRQQTMRALIDWSYDLLNENEKLLFRRLSVFAGGWTLESAEEICSDDELDSYEIIDILGGLLDKSLIASKEENGTMRFSMLESIRQYAKEMAGDAGVIKEKHSEYFSKIVDSTGVLDGSYDADAWARTIDVESANIKRAIFRSLANNQERAVDMLNSLCEYWVLRGHYQEGYIVCRKVLDFNELSDPAQKGLALYALGHMSSVTGNMQECRKLGRESLALVRSAGHKFGIANACNLVGLSLSGSMKQDDEAWEYYEEALRLFSEMGMKHHKATVLYNMSFVAGKRSDREQSLKLKEEALEIYRETGNPSRIAITLTALGSVHLKSGNADKARKYIEEALPLAERAKDKYLTSINLVLLGCVKSATGDYETAQNYFTESINISRQCGYAANIVPALYHAGDAYLKSGDHDNALKCYAESVKTGSERGIDFYLVHNMIGLGLTYYAKEDLRRSLELLLMAKKVLNGTYGMVGKEKTDEAEERIAEILSRMEADESERIRISVDKINETEITDRLVNGLN